MGFEPAPTTLQRTFPAVLTIIGVGAVVFAFTAQYAFGLEPCNLCIAQRVPYVGIALIGWVGLRRPEWISPGNLTATAGFVFLLGAVIASYHVGVEQHWWVSAAGCGGEAGQAQAGKDAKRESGGLHRSEWRLHPILESTAQTRLTSPFPPAFCAVSRVNQVIPGRSLATPSQPSTASRFGSPPACIRCAPD